MILPYCYCKTVSAQLMLDKFSLVELLAMDLHQLQDNLPWIPMKILKVNSIAIAGIQYLFEYVATGHLFFINFCSFSMKSVASVL